MNNEMSNTPPERQRLLRIALRCNGIFSLVSGALLVILNREIVHLLGLAEGNSLAPIGISLLVFAGLLFMGARKSNLNVAYARVVVLMDLAWVLGSYILVFLAPFSSPGKWIVAIVAEFVLAFAIAQWLGIRRIAKNGQYA